ncbi:MAG: 3-hydroxyacyl-CoA dehydrogenase NAD-binding domain-containing protein [Acidobacteriota bacterium]
MVSFSPSVELENRNGIGLLWVDNPPVNAQSQHVREGLQKAFAHLSEDESVKAVVLLCRGRTFIAGADIKEFGRPRLPPDTNEIRVQMEALDKPLVAAIHGTALGGGLETAMCCHYRVAVPSAKVGLPEVKLGILPAGGGTQRMPRLVGVERALDLIVSGRHVPAAEAVDLGILDALVGEDALESDALAFARKLVDEDAPLRRLRDVETHRDAPRENPQLFAEFRRRIARKTRGFNAPEACIQCVEAAATLPFDEGLRREAELSAQLHADPQSKAQRHYFFAERAARKIADVPKETPERRIARVGVLGAGTMGGGISMNFASMGLPVRIVEREQEALERGLGIVRKNYERTAKRGGITAAQVDERMELLGGGTDFEALADCDLIIEAVFENMELKKEIFRKLDGVAKPGAILATNTSYLDVNEIAAATNRPQDVIGMHFFSPANIMKLVEVVRGDKTAPDVIATAMGVSRRIDKIPVLVGVCHGFVGNRMLAKRREQADKLVLEGALPWDVDRVLYDFGLPMGPFRMSDLAGLDIGWSAETSTSSTLREVLCERGRRGQKTGKGYYVYDAESRAASPDPEVEELVAEFSKKLGIERREINDQEILERCLYPMVNEGARILEEGVAQRASDIDVIWVNGYGWPVYTGGPMFWAEQLGLAEVASAYERYAEALGADDWQLSPRLRKLAAAGDGFGS